MFGRIVEYNSDKETFHNYVERMVHFFEADSIAEEKMKPVFLAACGAKTYEFVAAPKSVGRGLRGNNRKAY